MRRPVDLIIPDTGPLISLATADRLELLASFGRPVLIPDVIKEEALAKPGSPGHHRLSTWFGGLGHNQFEIVKTPLIGVYHDLRSQPDDPDGTPAANGMGETTLMWVIANVERLHAPDTMCLVLTEDGRAGDTMPADVHVLSTRSWLAGLERLKVIESAKAVITAVEENGRTPSRYSRDQRGRDPKGNTTEWTNTIVLADEPRAHPRSTGTTPSTVARQKDSEETDDESAESIELFLVTRPELRAAIELSKDGGCARDGIKGTDAVVDLLTAAKNAIIVDTSRWKRSQTKTGEIIRGVEALNMLESGFGSGRYRSVGIDRTALKRQIDPAHSSQMEMKIHSARTATSDRSFAKGKNTPVRGIGGKSPAD